MRPDSQPIVLERNRTMRRIFANLLAAVAVLVAGCSLDITNPNSPTPRVVKTSPRTATGQMLVGVLATYRDNRAVQIRAFGSFGRESYYMFLTDGRFITGPYKNWRQNNAFEAGTQWGVRYQNYRNAYEAMKAVNATPTGAPTPTALTGAEKAGALGVLQTFIALDMLHVIEARGAIGAVVDLTGRNRQAEVYMNYSLDPGDVLNLASFQGDRNFYVHPSIDSIPGVASDDRYRRKVALSGSACSTNYTSPQTEVGVTATHRACTYPTNVTPVPIIRTQELA